MRSRDIVMSSACGPQIRCISLRQPWASLVALGEKQVETRSWQIRFRGVLGIHASRRVRPEDAALLSREPFQSSLLRGGIASPLDLPTGHIVGMCRIIACEPHTPDFIASLSARERAFGTYAPGRWGWLISDPHPLPQPIPARGRLGIWTADTEIAAQLAEYARQFYPELQAESGSQRAYRL